MTDTRVPKGAHVRLGTLSGSLHVETGTRIDVDGRLVVPGECRFEGNSEVGGDLDCDSFRSEGGTVRVQGNLVVQKDLHAEDATLEVDGELRRFASGEVIQDAAQAGG